MGPDPCGSVAAAACSFSVTDRVLPAASDGSRVFLELGCEVEALDLGTGATAWTADVTYGTNGNCNPYSTTLGAPSVSNGVVYAGAWDATAAYDAATGAVRWKTHRGTTGGSPVLSNGVLVTQEINNVTEFGWGSVPVGLDARTGLLLWTADSGATGPASVSGDLVLVPSSTTVRGYDIRDGSAVWDSGTLSTNDIWTTPAVAANRVFVPSFDGTIRALGPP